MVFADIHGACDVFSRVYDDYRRARRLRLGRGRPQPRPRRGRHRSSPLATCTERLKRRNLMVKIPATAEGVPAIRQMISEGRNINVTLIFSLDRHQEVMEAYISGLEQFADDPAADLSRVASVASFFISRVDTEVDRRLEAIGTEDALALRGKAGARPGQARLQACSSRRSAARGGIGWRPVAPACSARCGRAPAPRTRPTPTCCTSTSLIGPDTVNTLPEATLEAFDDHGTLARTVDADFDERRAGLGGAGRGRRRHGRRQRPARARGRRLLHQELRRADRSPRRPRPTSSAPDPPTLTSTRRTSPGGSPGRRRGRRDFGSSGCGSPAPS